MKTSNYFKVFNKKAQNHLTLRLYLGDSASRCLVVLFLQCCQLLFDDLDL